ncbi:MAG: methyl-accepting chemotaxis protein [Bacteroidales bacterium]|nr:methyl-accepting chemotaxis protein [Bacteroidales bacterium]
MSSLFLLLIFMTVGSLLTLAVYRFIFKTGISFITGIFFIIQSIVTGVIVKVDIVSNPIWDNVIGLSATLVSAFMMAYAFDRIIGLTFRDLSKKIKLLSDGKLDVTIDNKHLRLKSEAGKIARSVNELIMSLNQGVSLVKMVSNGHLYFDVSKLRKDADLDIALINMITKLREMSGEVQLAAEHVKVGSAELNYTAQQLAQGANEQASSAEEIATTMEQMEVSNQHNTENAERTNKIANAVTNDIKTVNDSIAKTSEAMNNIAEKISIITEIAEKTDILAINAAIEAARAGEYGKGFAVVASEVRDLAEHSQKAANEIIQVSSTSLNQVNQSKELLDNVYPEVQRTSVLVEEIAAASREQSKGISEVNVGIQQLSSVVQQNSSSSEQMAANSEELNAQSEKLNETISFFKLEEAGDNISETDIKKQIEILNELLEKKAAGKSDDKTEFSDKNEDTALMTEKGVNLSLDSKEYENY